MTLWEYSPALAAKAYPGKTLYPVKFGYCPWQVGDLALRFTGVTSPQLELVYGRSGGQLDCLNCESGALVSYPPIELLTVEDWRIRCEAQERWTVEAMRFAVGLSRTGFPFATGDHWRPWILSATAALRGNPTTEE